jgi:hypothetical protein
MRLTGDRELDVPSGSIDDRSPMRISNGVGRGNAVWSVGANCHPNPPTPKGQFLFSRILSGQGQLHAYEYRCWADRLANKWRLCAAWFSPDRTCWL